MKYETMTSEQIKEDLDLIIGMVKEGNIRLSDVKDDISKIEHEQNRRNEEFKRHTVYNEDGSIKQTQQTNMKTGIAEVIDYEAGKPVHSACFNSNGDVVRTAIFHDKGSVHKESFYDNNKNTDNYEYDENGKTLKSDHPVKGTDQREFVQYLNNKPYGAVVSDSNGKTVRSSSFTLEGVLREVKDYDVNGSVARTREYEGSKITFDSKDTDDNKLIIGSHEWIDVKNGKGENAKYLDLGQFKNELQATMMYEALYNAGIDFETKSTSLKGSSGNVISVTDPKAIEIINDCIKTGGINKPDVTPVTNKPTNNIKVGM